VSVASKLARYKELLVNLLPPGPLWLPKSQPVFNDLLIADAQELCRVDDRAEKMRTEVDPRTATDAEALDQWEGVLGLPDECTEEGRTERERQTQATQKLTNIGGLSKEFYEFIGAQFGFDITVENHVNCVAGRARAGDRITNYFNRHAVAGSVAGTPLSEVGWRHYYNVEMPITASQHAVAGSVAGTPVRVFSNLLIECTMIKLKPAHAMPFFTFIE